MRRVPLLSVCAGLTMAAGAAVAQPAAVTSYPASFFAPFQPANAMAMIARLPGFTFDRGDAVRGFGGAASNVLLDGARPAAKDDSIDAILGRIPAASVLRIDVIRGGAPGIDMQGKTIIANVIRRADAGVSGSLAVNGIADDQGRKLGAVRLQAEARKGKLHVEGSLIAAANFDDGAGSGPRHRADGADAPVFDAGETQKGVGARYKATLAVDGPALGGTLKLSGSVDAEPYDNVTYDTLTSAPGAEYEHYHQTQDTAEFGARYARDFTGATSLEVYALQQLGRGHVNDDFTSDAAAAAVTGDDRSDLFDLHKTTGESILRATFKDQIGRALALQAGLEGDYNWLNTTTYYVENGAVVALPAADVQVTEARGEAFATVTWAATRQLNVEGGFRFEASHIASTGDVISGRSLFYPKPRLAVTWSPDPADQVRLRLEREVGQINFDDYTAQTAGLDTGTVHAGNPGLNPQQDWVIEGAYERRFWGAGDATVTLRHYALTDVVDRVPDPTGSYDEPGNLGDGTKDEAVFALTLPLDKLWVKRGLLTGQVTLRDSRVIDPTLGLPRPISVLHPSDWEAHFTQGLPRWQASWGFDINGPWRETAYRFDEIDTDKLSANGTVFFEVKVRRDVSVRVEARNVTARRFEHTRQVFDGPRGTYPLAFTDVRDLETPRMFWFRVQKTFG